LSWPITASALNTEGNRVILANNVDDVEVEQFSRGNIFSPDWPPTNERHHVLSLPRMIRITIILEDGSETTRLLPGLDFDPNPTTGLTGLTGSDSGSGSGSGSTPVGDAGANGN